MKKLITYGMILLSCVAFAQEKEKEKKDKDLPKGNVKYAEKKYAEAEADYRVSASKFPDKQASVFNLGNSIYRQDLLDEAKAKYEKVVETAQTHFEKHRAYHNLGNIYMAKKKYQEAVEAYKNALRNNPADEQTRYNYALAKQFLKKDPPPPPKKNPPQPKPQPQPQPQNNPQDNQNQGDNQDKNQNPDQQNNDGPKPKPSGGIPKQRLESLLKAIDNEEKKVQEKINKNAQQNRGKKKAPPAQTGKEW